MLTPLLTSLALVLSPQAAAPAPPPAPAPSVAPSPVPRNPALPANDLQAKAALEESPRHGEYVDVRLPSGGPPIRTWVSYPERKDKAGVVIVLHEIYGLSDWIRAVADQLAREGFIAVAPDLISGRGPNGGGTESVSSRDDVVGLVRGLSPEDARARIAAVRQYALALPAAGGTSATLGFCWGGARSFAYAAAEPALNAAVVYYGTSPDASDLARVKAPVLGLYGGDDARVNATIEPAKAELARLGRTYEPHVYEGAGHGFLKMQTAREGANLAATRQAWPRTIAFLRQHLSGAATPAVPAPLLRPPVARKQPKKLQLHGDTLVDDYHWMRNKGTPEVEQYLKAELAYAEAFMKPTAALQNELYGEMLSRIQQTDTNVPYRERGHFYYSRTEEGKQYPIYARRKGSLDAAEEIILDVNQLAAGKQFMSVGEMKVSPDESLLAYTTDDTGFRQYTLRVMALPRDGMAADVLGPKNPIAERVTSVEWSEDGSALFYGVEDAQTKRSHQLFRNTRSQGTAAKDELVYDEKDERFSVYVWKSRDRKYLFVQSGSLTSTEIRFFPADQPGAEMRVISPRAAEHEYDVDHRDGTFWIRTNDKGRNFRLVAAPASDPGRANWKEVVAHRDDVMLAGHGMFKDFYTRLEREGGFPRIRITDFRTGQDHRIDVPEEASTISPGANREFDTGLYRFAYQSPITSSSIYDYDPATRKRTLLKQVAVLGGFDKSRYKVEITRATASDGAQVPVWMVYRGDLQRDGTNPALLYAYGSYGAPMSAGFSSNIFSLVDRGAVYAVAYIRGGGELGKKWHDEGRMLKKKNTFTDFIAAAEHLVASKYTSKDRLAIMGGSAGGLLMGAVTNLRPDLFGVVVSYVPFVDVINTMLDKTLPLTVGEFEEWGNPEIADQYRYMLSYSPYDQIARKVYPAILVKTSYNDSQVMYWEPAKYVAKLRAMKTDSNPLVFNVNMDPAGHGGKSGRYDKLREVAFDYAFILWQLGVEQPRDGADFTSAEPRGVCGARRSGPRRAEDR